ncbi:herpeto-tandem family RiPP [Cystobacter fuscus]|uniref:herpeto-tandem family RiPP n=1 Tax=Cystobacter fuscus TaxID=43 RepID=UPI0037BEA0C4
MLTETNNSQKSPIFGLQYIEEEEANLLDVVGCTGLSSGSLEPTTPTTPAVTIKLCGDGFDVSDMELSV